MSAGGNRIGGTDKDVFHACLVFLLAKGVELLAYPVGDVFGQIVNKGKEFVGRHDDHDAEDDQHGECTGDANDFCLHGSADKYLETRAEQSSHHVHEDDGGKEAANHERRTDDDAEQEEIAPFAVLARSAVPFGQGMGTEPERGRDQSFHHQNNPADES